MKKKTLLIVMLILVVSFFVVNGVLAIFRASANSTGNLALASWDVSLQQTGVENYISIIPGDATSTAQYTLNVRNLSEVDIIYSIIIDDVPSGVSIALDDGTFVAETNNQVIFNEVGTIHYSDQNKTKSHTLTFKGDYTAAYATDEEINVNVLARQILPN